jgi:predicted CoA-binding protein
MQWDQPAFFVANALHSSGVDVIPVPVYYPDVTHILGKSVIRNLADVEGPVDILDVFRRPQDIPAHVDDILKLKPDVVWLQSGITNPEVEEQLAREGIKVVSNRCLKVDRQMSRM